MVVESERSASSQGILAPIRVDGWPRPRGYENAMMMNQPGQVVFLAGQIGWLPDGTFATDSLVGQFAQALDNVLAILSQIHLGPGAIARLTVYVTDLPAYRLAGAELAAVWRERMGKHFPAMALVGVAGLVEPRAKVEMEATAVMPSAESSTRP